MLESCDASQSIPRAAFDGDFDAARLHMTPASFWLCCSQSRFSSRSFITGRSLVTNQALDARQTNFSRPRERSTCRPSHPRHVATYHSAEDIIPSCPVNELPQPYFMTRISKSEFTFKNFEPLRGVKHWAVGSQREMISRKPSFRDCISLGKPQDEIQAFSSISRLDVVCIRDDAVREGSDMSSK